MNYNEFTEKALLFSLKSKYGSSLELRSKLLNEGSKEYMNYFVKFRKDKYVFYASFVDWFEQEEKFLRAAHQSIRYLLWEFDHINPLSKDGSQILQSIVADKLKFEQGDYVDLKFNEIQELCFNIAKENRVAEFLENIEDMDLFHFIVK